MAVETTGEDEKAAGLGVQVIARAASVLRALEGRPEGLSLGQIAKEVGSPARPFSGSWLRWRRKIL